MNKLIASFEIDKNHCINVYMRDEGLKNDLDYASKYMLGDALVMYEGKEKILLAQYGLREIFHRISELSNKLLNNQLVLPKFLQVGSLGRECNIEIRKNRNILIHCQDYWLFSTKYNGAQTWIYTFNDKIILEICPFYSFFDHEPKNHEKFVSFMQFMKIYKPYVVLTICRETLEEWKKIADEGIKKIKNPAWWN